MKKINKQKVIVVVIIAFILLLVTAIYIRNISDKKAVYNDINNQSIDAQQDIKIDIAGLEKIDVFNDRTTDDSIFEKRYDPERVEDDILTANKNVYFVNKKTGDKITLIFNKEYSGRNPVYDIIYKENIIGSAMYNFNFHQCSSNKRYCIKTDISFCGAACVSKSVGIIDLNNLSGVSLKPLYQDTSVIYKDRTSLKDISNSQYFIESEKWIDDNTMELTAFYILSMSNGYYRVSPKQIWQYDILTDKYTLIKTLEDE